MKLPRSNKKLRRGFVSYVLVLGMGLTLTLLTISAYQRATMAHKVQAETQIRVDFADKEDEILRSIVNITPNRAIRAMKSGASSEANRLRWQAIFSDALTQANARSSVSAQLQTGMGAGSAIVANNGDSTLANLNNIFDAIEPEPGYMSTGMNRSLGTGFPVPLQGSTALADQDKDYPIITHSKIYSNLASSGVALPVATYSRLNVIPYPEIRFGYSAPGQPFVAKRNWWAFSMQLGENDQVLRSFSRGDGSVGERDFVLSIYEIPSQLAISAESFVNLGKHADGDAWANTTIEGAVYTTRAEVGSGLHIDRLSGRRGLTLSNDVSVGENELGGNPFDPGVRETYEIKNHGEFMPVTLASESGRSAFIPINRERVFFDRFWDETIETNVLSPTTWNDYSIGARQCAVRLDVVKVVSSTDITPTEFRLSCLTGPTGTGTRKESIFKMNIPFPSPLEDGWAEVASEGGSFNTNGRVYDVAYGIDGYFYYRRNFTGTINFNNATWTDPRVGFLKKGYVRPARPFDVKLLRGSKRSIAIYPERLPDFIAALGGSGPRYNNSLVVNVDYRNTGLNNEELYKPRFPCSEDDCGVLMTECDDLSRFERGFSVVTNMRLYIGDDFNIVPTVTPAGLTAPFFPPCSLFAPEKRYGTEKDPGRVEMTGQVGHLGGDTGSETPVHLLDMKMSSGVNAAASKIDVNLKPITHPAALPPIYMMNWLVTVEERRKAFYNSDGSAR
jgi:hypothetical protein